MPKRDVAIEILNPISGLNKAQSPSMIGPKYSPNLTGCNMYYGVVQKDYGTSLLYTATSTAGAAPASLIYQADFGDNSTLQVLNGTGMYIQSGTGFVADSPAYTATYTDYWYACMHNNKMIYTNGKGFVQCKAAYNSTGTVMGGVESGSYGAFCVVSFKDHLNLYHTIEAGSENYKRVRWSKVGLLSYASADWSAGTANFLDIQDMEGNIQTALKLGNGAVAIYGENSIHLQEWVGGSTVYQFTKMVSNLGTISRRGVVANDNVHYIVTLDNVYEYNGGTNVTPIGDAIKSEWISNLNQNAAGTVFVQYVKDDDELRVYIPTQTSTRPDTCYICKVKEGYAWYKSPRNYRCAGEYSRPANLTIGDLVGNIGAQNWTFGDLRNLSGARMYILGDDTGHVVKMDKTVYSISIAGTSAAQTFTWDSKDISSVNDVDPLVRDRLNLTAYMDNDTRWQRLKIELKGQGTCDVSYSIDGGNTFITCDESPITLTDNWYLYTLDMDICSRSLMFRIANNNTNEVVHMRYGKVEFIPGSEV